MKISEFIELLDKKNFSLAVEKEKLILKGNNKNIAKNEIDDIKKNEFVINFIKEHKDELIEYISKTGDSRVEKKSKDITSIYSLSSLQEGMLFHGLYGGTSGAYTEQFCCDLVGPNTDIIIKSWDYTLRRHSILRSGIFYDSFNVPVQCVYREVRLPVTILDYRDMEGDMQSAAVKEFEETDRLKGFDFKSPPLMRIGLLRLAEDRYRMVWTSHHILFDGWSMAILMSEFLNIYEMLLKGKEVPEVEEDKYEDYIRFLEREDKEQQEEFWRNYMKGVEQSTLLPFIGTTSERTRGTGSFESVKLDFDKETTSKIGLFAHKHRVTINTIIQGVWSFLLHRYSGSNDIVFGIIVSGRPDDLPRIEQRVGLYINTLPLHSTFHPDQQVNVWLQNIQESQFSSRQHQYASLTDIQEWTGIRGDFFDNILVFENYPVREILGTTEWSLRIENVNIKDQTNYPLTIIVGGSEELFINFNYNTGLLKQEYVNEICGHFENVLMQVIENKKNCLGEIELLTKPEESRLLDEFNDTEADYPKNKSIVDLFEEQTEKTPDSIALVFEDHQLTYKELNERSNKLAHYLSSKGVKEDTLVPICIERSPEMIIGVLGILKAGGAYVPVDPEYPDERISFILEDTGAVVMVTGKETMKKLRVKKDIEIVEADGEWATDLNLPDSNLSVRVLPDNLTYVLYTSGSTGKPKGVRMPGSGLVNLLIWQEKQFVNKQRNVLQFTSLNFDVSFQEIFSTLCFGSTLYLINETRRIDMSEVLKDIAKYKITHLFIPYIVLKNLAEYFSNHSINSSSLEVIITAGEQLKITKEIEELLNKGNIELTNQYGPTEAHVVSSYTIDINGELSALPPIGRPVDNTQLYILSDKNQFAPIGVPGELYIGGVQVARGYLNLPDLTKEKFIDNPFIRKAGSKIYKTGDLCRWLPDGNIEYLGRIDDQVKIRGYRVELGEIESVLQDSELVNETAVLAREDASGNKMLVGYVVPNGEFDKDRIVSYLRSKLPEYMVPSLWVKLDKLPLTSTGKIDKKILPNPDVTEFLRNEYVAPRNITEEKLSLIWQELLGVEKLGIHDNFFELGGHSLLAMRLISSIRKNFEVEMKVNSVFEYSTIESLAGKIRKAGKSILPPISVQERPERIPLSFSQERLWFIDRLEGSVHYHIPSVLRLTGKLNKNALDYALQNIVNRHEVLRTVIIEEEGKGFQLVKDNDSWELQKVNGSIYKEDVERLQNYIQQLINVPFDLSKDHMMRGHLISLDEFEHVLVVTMHHIASDGWSASVIVRELVEFYEAYEEDREDNLNPLQIQYADYAMWQRNYLHGEVLDKKLDYWKKKLEGVEPLQMPTDYNRPAIQSTRGAAAGFSIDKEMSGSLQTLSQQYGTTLFMTLLSAFNVLLHRYSGQQDICVGSPIAGRQQEEVEGLVGFFLNTLALRSNVISDASFSELLQQVRTTTLEAFEYQDVPFEKIVDSVVKQRDMSRSPLFQVMFVLQNTPEVSELRLGELSLSSEEFKYSISKFDLTFSITETPEGMQGIVEYCTDLYNQQTIDRMITHFKELLSSIVKNPHQKIGLLQMLTGSEEHQLLKDFNDTEVTYPKDKTIIDLFEEQVTKTPHNTAVVFEDEELTYRALNERSNQLAHYLRNKGVKEEILVPICIERSIDMIVGILGILKAGGAYVPIDPEYPEDRIKFMLEDTGAAIIISNKDSAAKLKASGDFDVISLDEDLPLISKQPAENLQTSFSSNQLAYVIYTSGSTGHPKGVMNEHGGIANRLNWAQDYFKLTSEDSILQKTTFCFDVSVWELLWPLLAGSRLVFAKPGGEKDTWYLKSIIEKEQITMLHFVPSMLEIFLTELEQGECTGLKKVLCSGEALKPAQAELFIKKLPQTELHNLYGPTEAAIDVTYWSLNDKDEDLKIIPIGRPVSNTSMYILDSYNNLVPIGCIGQLHIGGIQVARGYLNRPELTQEKFINDPFSKEAGGRLYKTGDLGRWLPDGSIEYMGRMDDQVKIRGFRIELGEIEIVLHGFESVQQAVVLARETKEGARRLVAYVVPKGEFDKEAITYYLRSRLPEYMVPALWVVLDKLPLTKNGKPDRKALPDPDASELITNEFVAPGNEMEEKLADIWKELLKVDRVGMTDNFFELGGDSIKVISVVHKLRQLFNKEIKVFDIYRSGTLYELIPVIENSPALENGYNEILHATEEEITLLKNTVLPSIPDSEQVEDIYPMSDIQIGMVFASLVNPDLAMYHDQFVHLMSEKINPKVFEEALSLMVEKHSVLRTAFNLDLNKEGIQIVYKSIPVKVENLEFQYSTEKEVRSLTEEYLRKERSKPFEFDKAPLWRATLIYLKSHTVFIFQFHHAILDGWSIASFVTELNNLYLNLLTNPEQESLKLLKCTYRDFVVESLTEKKADENREFWINEMSGYKRLDIFTEENTNQNLNKAYSKDFVVTLNKRLKEDGLTLKGFFLGAFLYSLSMLTYEDELTIGLVTNNRPLKEDGEKVLGCFLNSIPFRFKPEQNSTWKTYFEHIEDKIMELKNRDRTTLFDIVNMTGTNAPNENPFFDVLFSFINFHVYNDLMSGLLEFGHSENTKEESTEVDSLSYELSNTYLDFYTQTNGENALSISFSLRKNLKSGKNLEDLVNYFEKVIKCYLEKPEEIISKNDIIPAQELDQVLVEFNDTAIDYPKDKTIIDLFEEQVIKTPDNIALVFEDQQLTFAELNERSNQFAHYLQGKGVKEETLVPICIESSIEMIVGILGIIKAGGAYIPVDPEYPEERIAYMLEDAGAFIAVTSKRSRLRLSSAENIDIIEVDGDWFGTPDNLQTKVKPHQLAYVIYTSGSTGRPKGVMIEHKNLTSYLLNNKTRYINGGTTGSGSFIHLSYTFDASISGMFMPLISGKRVVIGNKQSLDVFEDKNFEKYAPYDFIKITPSHMELLQSKIKTETGKLLTRKLVVGGETLLMSQLSYLFENGIDINIVNEYGPTETTVGCTVFSRNIFGENGNSINRIPIGKPIDNAKIYILSENKEPVPVGVPGEIYIGGEGLARGYLNRPELTQEKFIKAPFSNEAGERLYRTGDLARWLPDGNIEFLGRKDEQVKIRGYRIELGEIESVMQQSEMVSNAVVLARENKEGDKQLVGYVVSEGVFDKALIVNYLKSKLPEYMIPSLWVELKSLPLTSNGKIDKKALPDPDVMEKLRNQYVAPRNETEEKLTEMWQKLLDVDRVGIYDNFFELGGHSLLATRAITLIRKEFSLNIPIKILFDFTCIADLSNYIDLINSDMGEKIESEVFDL